VASGREYDEEGLPFSVITSVDMKDLQRRFSAAIERKFGCGSVQVAEVPHPYLQGATLARTVSVLIDSVEGAKSERKADVQQGRRLLGGRAMKMSPGADCDQRYEFNVRRMPGLQPRCCTTTRHYGQEQLCEPFMASSLKAMLPPCGFNEYKLKCKGSEAACAAAQCSEGCIPSELTFQGWGQLPTSARNSTATCLGNEAEFRVYKQSGGGEDAIKGIAAVRTAAEQTASGRTLQHSYNGNEAKPGTCLQAEGVLREALGEWRFEKSKMMLSKWEKEVKHASELKEKIIERQMMAAEVARVFLNGSNSSNVSNMSNASLDENEDVGLTPYEMPAMTQDATAATLEIVMDDVQ